MRIQFSKITLAAALGLALAFTISCDSASNPSALVGHWQCYEYSRDWTGKRKNKCTEELREMELFKDGTGVIKMYSDRHKSHNSNKISVSWKVDNKRFVIQSPLFAMTSDYKTSDYKLTLISEDGNITYLDEAYYATFEAYDAIEEEAKEAYEAAKDVGCKSSQCGQTNESHKVTYEAANKAYGKVFGYSDNAIAETIKKNNSEAFKNINEAASKAYDDAKANGASYIAAGFAATKIYADADKTDKYAKAYVAAYETAKATGAPDEAADEAAELAAYEVTIAKYADKAVDAFKSAKASGASYEAALEAVKVAIKAVNSKKKIME